MPSTPTDVKTDVATVTLALCAPLVEFPLPPALELLEGAVEEDWMRRKNGVSKVRGS